MNFLRHRLVLFLLTWFASAAHASEPFTVSDMMAYLVEHRADVAAVSLTAGKGGLPSLAQPVLVHRAFEPMPLGSTIKIVILAAYAREVEAGRLDPGAPVTLAAWERAYLPGSDSEAHPRALAALGIPFDELGFALDGEREVPLSALVDAMMRFSDNAAPDFLLELLGEGVLRATMREAGLAGQQSPLPVIGYVLATHNHVDGPLTTARVAALARMPKSRLAALSRSYATLYADPTWRAAELAWQLATPAPEFALRAAAAEAVAPRGIAFDYAFLMSRVAAGTFLSRAISARMAAHMTIAVSPDDPAFRLLLGKGGTLDGNLTFALLAVPKSGPFANRPRVSVIFLRHVPEDLFEQLDAEQVPFVLSALLAFDADLVAEAGQALAGGVRNP